MSKTIFIISTSLRPNSNSEILAEEFAKGAKAAGHTVEKVSLLHKTIHFCIGCLACQQTGRCVLEDDTQGLVQKMRSADVIAFATPVYYYEMSGQMKTLLDRANPLYASDYAFSDIYLLAAAADSDKSAMDGAIHGLQGWIDCFSQARLAGVVCGTDVSAPKAIHNHKDTLQAAYQMGYHV